VLHNNTRLRTLAKERLKRGDTKKEPTEKDIKAACLSIGLEDLLWRLGQGGTCPLSCGNCFDDHPDHPNTVHRCASKPGRAFGRPIAGGIGPTLRIPLH
jgi:homoaconitase/3-isopropylmalate dehydratase large subunit